MILRAETVTQIAAQCAPQAAPQTLLALARVESGLDPLAIGVNGARARRIRPASLAQAVANATALLAGGANIDLGLAQINSANLRRLGLGVAEAFDPCRSLAAGATLLGESYRAARGPGRGPQAALRVALSLYNTGDAARGLHNGYVARVVAAATGAPTEVRLAAAASADRPDWDVFGEVRQAGFVFSPTLSLQGVR